MPGLEIFEIVLPAAVAGLAIALIHSVLGIEVLRRGIIFIDLAIAQIAGLCVVLTSLWMHEPSWSETQVVAGLAALLAAVFFRWVEKIIPNEQEAIIGSCFVLAASAVPAPAAGRIRGHRVGRHRRRRVMRMLRHRLLLVRRGRRRRRRRRARGGPFPEHVRR